MELRTDYQKGLNGWVFYENFRRKKIVGSLMRQKEKTQVRYFTLPKGATRERVEIWIDGKCVPCVRETKIARALVPSTHVETLYYTKKSFISRFEPLKPLFKFPNIKINETKR